MIPIAIIGVGAISDSHLQAYLRFPERCRVVALVDLYPDKAAAKAAKYGLEARVFPNVQALIETERFAAASICLPPFEHAPAAIELLRAGKHVLVEKPMATCLAECDAMLEAAQVSGTTLSVVAQNRFKTPMMKLRQVLASGLVGRILHAQVESYWWRGGNYYDLWWRGTWEKEGGGCTMNHAVHQIDLYQWFVGMPVEVRAIALNLAHANSEVEDYSTAVLRHEHGGVGQISASLVHHGEEQRLLFQGEFAQVGMPWALKAVRQKENGFPEEDPQRCAQLQAAYEGFAGPRYEGHDGQIDNFLAAIEGREPLLIDGRDGRRTIELITAIYQASQVDGPVRLPLSPEAPFYTREGILAQARRFHRKTRSVENFTANEITLGKTYANPSSV